MHHILTRPRKSQYFGTAPEAPSHIVKTISLVLPLVLIFTRDVVPTVNRAFHLPQTPSQFTLCLDVDTPCKLKIPKIIHQTYKSTDLPPAWKSAPAMWRETHPDWKYMFWTDEKNRELIATKFPWFLDTFDGYVNPIQRADAVRYFILYEYGGVYADMDLFPLRSLEPMLRNSEAMLSETPNVGLTNAFMSSTAKNDFFKFVIDELERHKSPLLGRFSRHWHIMLSTGPTFIWKMASDYARCPDRPNRITVDTMPAWVWGKCKICKRTCTAPPDGFLQHAQGDSWHHWDSWLFTHGIFCHVEVCIGLAWVALLLIDKHVTRRYQPFWTNDWTMYYVVSLGILAFF
eukprot:m.134137 g.134137  ORF g.134137 m.134137 type:complete len:345 (+) comp11376_c0_seq6:313-1347(+)